MRSAEPHLCEPERRQQGSLPGAGNAALLIASFGVGQGSIFVVQTWLIGREKFELLAHFGTLFSFAVLALIIVDLGAVTTVARRISLAGCEDRQAEIGNCYWQASFMRLCVAGAVSLIGLCYAALTDDAFNRCYVTAALPAFLLWSFNANGLLDGLKLSGLSGLAGVSTYAVSAVALAMASDAPPEAAGFLLGSALSVGVLLSVAIHLAILRRAGHLPAQTSVAWRQSLALAREGASVLFAVMPGQISFRFQIIVCSLLLGEAATAVFLYGRQIAAAVSQVLEFVRRAHFPLLVRALASDTTGLRTVFRTQSTASWLAVLLSSVLFAAGIFLAICLDGLAALAAVIVSLFSVGVLTGALSQTLSQAGQALGRYGVVAWAANAAMVAGFAASALFAWMFGLVGLAVSEVLTHVVAALFLCLTIFRASFGHSRSPVTP